MTLDDSKAKHGLGTEVLMFLRFCQLKQCSTEKHKALWNDYDFSQTTRLM